MNQEKTTFRRVYISAISCSLLALNFASISQAKSESRFIQYKNQLALAASYPAKQALAQPTNSPQLILLFVNLYLNKYSTLSGLSWLVWKELIANANIKVTPVGFPY